MWKTDVSINNTVTKSVQLTVDFHFVVVSLRPNFASEFLAQIAASQYNQVQLVVF